MNLELTTRRRRPEKTTGGDKRAHVSTATNQARTVAVILFCLDVLAAFDPQAAAQRFSWPKPKYSVRIEKSIMVPMRDGVRLSTDIYFPEGIHRRLPVVLIRTPYNKRTLRGDNKYNPAYRFAGQGYIVVVQDTRGRFESEGDYTISTPDGQDGYDTISWVALQSWANGKVGTYGCSYLGENQIETAKLRNPMLMAMIPKGAGGASRYFGSVFGGAIELASSVGWFWESGSKLFLRPPLGTGNRFWATEGQNFDPAPNMPVPDYRRMWSGLPVVDILKEFGGPPTDFTNIFLAPDDPWWANLPYISEKDEFDTPALHVDSWYDYGVADVLYQFNLMRTNATSSRARRNQFIIISPAAHCQSENTTEHTMIGERDVGDPQFDYYGLYLRWFDYWLKGIKTGVTRMPRVQIYVMGRNQWRGENEWPLSRTKFTKYYLHSHGDANSSCGGGTLNTGTPVGESNDNYTYDPGSPVPSRGGPVCCTGTPDAPAGAFNQAEIEARHDVLVYTTHALEKGIEVTGPLKVILYVSSSAKDTDFTAKLVDVYPEGQAYNIQEGILRARYRKGYSITTWMNPGEIYELTVDLQATSNYFAPGHRIRLEISSSNFPRFDRNLNTGGNNYDEAAWVLAHNTIHHSEPYSSYILLPIVP
jgi:predicted acyl esterase